MSAPSHREEDIFEQALGIESPEARDAYLRDACGDDANLLGQLRGLLGAHDRAGRFLEHQKAQCVAPVFPQADAADTARSAADQTARAPSERPGDRIGRYKLLERIGEGGFGDVWRAEQEEPVRRRVALKIIKLGMDTRSVVARFEAERQALALMDHPNIARVHDGDATETGRPYFVMELVHGIRITGYCDQNNLPTAERLKLFMQVCRAVQHAHQKGIIHRDLKPSNILVTEQDGCPMAKVIDFGIAKATEGRLTDKTLFTGFQQWIGTPAYMSPEQAAVMSMDIDTRSDIYSLGVLLYELLTGRTPFDTRELLAAGLDEIRRVIREQEPTRPSTRLSTLAAADLATVASRRQTEAPKLINLLRGDLDWIVMKCLEKDRARRYETANGLATDLQRHLSHEPVVACPPSTFYRWQKFARKHRRVVAAAAAFVGLLIIATVASSVLAMWANRERVRAVQSEKSGQEMLREAYLAQARANRFSGRAGRRFDSLDVLAKAVTIRPGMDLRNEAIACMALADLRLARDWPHATIVRAATLDEKFTVYARSDDRGNVRVHRLDTHEELALLPGPGQPTWQLQFSPDGRFLSTRHHEVNKVNPNTLFVWEWAKQRIIWRAPYNTSPPDFRRDSHVLAFQHWDGPIVLYDLAASNEVKRLATKVQVSSSFLQFSPDGRRLAMYSTRDPQIEILEVASGKTLASFTMPAAVAAVAWPPEGKLLAVSSHDRKAYLVEADTGRIRHSLIGHQGVPTKLVFTHAGDLVVTSGWDASTRLWDVTTGRLLVAYPAAMHHASRFNEQDGLLGLMIFPSGLGMLEVATGREWRTLAGHPGEAEHLFGVDFSRDSNWMASSGSDGVRLWNLATGKEAAFLPLRHGTHRGSARFHPDGKSLLTSGHTGVRRWPIVLSRNEVQLGPPHTLSDKRDCERACISPDGEQLAVACLNSEVLIFDLSSNAAVRQLSAALNTSSVAFSPDGSWLASGCWQGFGAPRIWNARTGQHVLDLPLQANVEVAFSPDGRWLVTASGSQYLFWETGTWARRRGVERLKPRQLAGDMCFSRDGTMLATGLSDVLIRLVEPDTGGELATLEAAMQRPLGFTPDGTRLVVAGEDQRLHIWNLRSIRQQLVAMKLDWDSPPFPAP